jgi:hypothetical protein
MRPALFASMLVKESAVQIIGRCCLIVVPLATIACGESTVCVVTAVPPRVIPGDTTVHSGQSFTLVLQATQPCARGNPTTIVPTHWTTPDTGVISLDTLTGLVTARAIGDAHVFSEQSPDLLPAAVHVR